MENQSYTKFTIKIFIMLSVFSVGIYCNPDIESKGTPGKDIDGQTLIEMGRRLRKPMLTILGMAIRNLHQCSEWSQWSECDATRKGYFGTRNRSRECTFANATSGTTRKLDTYLFMCEGGVEGRGKTVCPGDYNATTNGFCIKLYTTPRNHDDSEAVCKKDGGFLINIDSDLKYTDVKSLLNGFSVSSINIGGRRKDSDSQWEYTYGSSSGYFKWYSGYPVKSGAYLCLALESYLWWNLSCTSSKYPFLCEIPV